MEESTQAVTTAPEPTIEERPRPPAARRVLNALTLILIVFNIAMSVLVDLLEWFDVANLSSIVPYKGLWNGLLCTTILGVMLVLLIFKVRGFWGFILAGLGASFYLLTYLV